jgi:hypothetical protein
MILNDKASGTYCAADLRRAAQISRNVHLAFWLRGLFRKPLPRNLKQLAEALGLTVPPTLVVLADEAFEQWYRRDGEQSENARTVDF